MYKTISVIMAFLLTATYANAALVDNGDGTVTQYRNDGSALMWLKDVNYAMTSGYDADGMMSWYGAQNWIDTLNSSNSFGHNDWRLPNTLPVNGSTYNYTFYYDGSTDLGWNITSPNSEMSYMFYVELGNKGYTAPDGYLPQNGWGLYNTNPFIDFQTDPHADRLYWSGTDYSGTEVPMDDVFVFTFGEGAQVKTYKSGSDGYGYAWAVRDISVVPEPLSFILFTLGGFILGIRKYIKK